MLFKDRLSEILHKTKTSQRKLASHLGYSSQTVSKWVTGLSSPDPDTLSKIADFFNCSTDYLLGRVDYPELVVKKTPPEGGADSIEYHIDKDAPELTPDEILKIKEFLKDQERSSGG